MNPLGSRTRAEELALLLDGAVAGPGSLTAPYASLATRLRALAPALEAQLTPRPDFRTALRQRLVAVATVQAANPTASAYGEPVARQKVLDAAVSWTTTRKAQRRMGALAGGMAAVIAMTGVAVASSRSLPGQPFYSLKRASEGLQLDFTSGDTAKGTKHLEFAATRLREVRALAHGDSALSLSDGTHLVAAGLAFGGSLNKRITDTLADFNSETDTGTALLTKVYRKTGKPTPLRIITSFTSRQRTQLSDLLPSLPTAVRPEAQHSLTLITQVASEATDLLALGTCGGSCYPGNSGPTLPTLPVPTPGVTAAPTDSATPADDNNGVPACSCGSAPTPDDTPTEQATATPEPGVEPTPDDQPTPSMAPTPAPTQPVIVIVVPTIPGLPLPTILPTEIDIPVPPLPGLPLPTLPPLPLVPQLPLLPSLLPSTRG
jgi:hypothetical protein